MTRAGTTRVLILNTVALNGGDGAILMALMRGLRQRMGDRVSFIVHDANPEAAGRYYPGVDFRPTAAAALGPSPTSRSGEALRRIVAMLMRGAAGRGALARVARRLLPAPARQALRDYDLADAVVTTGGTYLVEHYSLDGRLLSFDLALDGGKPLLFFTQSLGPFHDPANRAELRRVTGAARLVLLRDRLSLQHLADLGGETGHCHVLPDSVFSLADPRRVADAAVIRGGRTGPLRVAISVRDWRNFKTRDAVSGMESYVQAIREATVYLVERYHAEITFLSTCQGIPEYQHDDARTARRVVDGLPGEVREKVTVIGDFFEPQALVQRLSSFDLVLSTRMHFAILSLIAGVPVIPIEYEFKMRELFEELGHGELVHDIETVRGSEVVASMDNLLADEARYRESLFAAVERARIGAEHGNDMLAALLADDYHPPERMATESTSP